MATQVPVLIDEREGARLFLRGHMMRNTDHHRAFEKNNEALCVFSGAHTYVSCALVFESANWIHLELHERACARQNPLPQRTRTVEDPGANHGAVRELTKIRPALFRHLPKAYVDSLKNAIIAFEIEVRALENVFKLSQSRDESELRKDYARAAYSRWQRPDHRGRNEQA